MRVSKQKRTKAQISFNMSRVRNKGSEIERLMEGLLRKLGLKPTRHPKIFGHPDFAFPHAKVAIFCDSHFWHGYDWKTKKEEIKRNRAFWIRKIENNIRRDHLVTRRLKKDGWIVLRFWEHQIRREPGRCCERVEKAFTKGEYK